MVSRRWGLRILLVFAACGALAAALAGGFSSSISARARTVGQSPPLRFLGLTRLAPQPGALAAGTVVARRSVGERIFPSRGTGFALARVGSTTYPVSSVNDGRVWRVDGPWLYREAADAPAAIDDIGVASPNMFYAYGPSVIDVTPDGGRLWWQTFLPAQDGFVVAIVPGFHVDLVAYVEQRRSHDRASPLATFQYVTSDGGRHWRYSTALFGG
jgi:hypothetical protein